MGFITAEETREASEALLKAFASGVNQVAGKKTETIEQKKDTNESNDGTQIIKKLLQYD